MLTSLHQTSTSSSFLWRAPFRQTLFFFAGLLCLSYVFPSQAKAQDLKRCAALFRQRLLVPAAECFLQMADLLGESGKIKPIERFKKGRLLLNAARLFNRASKKSATSDEKLLLFERSLKLFDRYLQEKLFETQVRRRSILSERGRLLKKHLFAKLRVYAYHPKAQICVQGAKQIKRCQTSYLWDFYLPEGAYKIALTYPDSAPIYRTVKLEATETYNHGFSPPFHESFVEFSTDDNATQLLLRGAALLEPLRGKGKLWRVKLPPGPYTVEIRYPKALPFQRTFQVSLAEKLVLRYPRPTAKIIITSSPSQAQVFIEELYSGQTPLTLLVPEGDFLLHVRSFCHKTLQKKVTVLPKSSYKLHLQLTAEDKYNTWKRYQTSLPQKRILGWSAIVGGLFLAGLATGSYIAGNISYRDALQQRALYYSTRTNFDQHIEAYASHAQAANLWTTVGHISAPLGAVAIGLGIHQLFQARERAPQSLGCEVDHGLLKRKTL
ncbi:MAG: PEGA domain-containing protein [Myxococcales bacterium]|nr:PEGA domain-containing protein [Myxococcales bacterium]MCB9644594.1 PEGA domain-containing protein [Myxococcales bacterium]